MPDSLRPRNVYFATSLESSMDCSLLSSHSHDILISTAFTSASPVDL